VIKASNRKALGAFALHTLAIFLGLAIITALAGIFVRAWDPGFDLVTMQSIAAARSQALTSIAGIVSDLGSFALLAPLAVAYLLLRRWKRPADDLALLIIALGCAALPSAVKLIVARPRPTIGSVTHLVTLSFPSEHSTQAAGIYLTIAIMLSRGLGRSWRGLVIGLAILVGIAVGWSRVYLGVHYPTDVLAGLLLGWSWALLVFRWARARLIETAGPEISRQSDTPLLSS
jgi:undecaprenyl-diphosphatase